MSEAFADHSQAWHRTLFADKSLAIAQWGLDILGLFPKASRLRKFLLVSTDYFTKWVEAVHLANIADSNVKTFL